ncbi:MAG: murein hydrolase activator EnvC family protein [Peptoniphilaceae bacterium]
MNKYKFSTMIIALSLIVPNAVNASSIKLEKQKELKIQEKNKINQVLKENKTKLKSVEKNVDSVNAEILELDRKMNSLNNNIAGIQKDIDSLNIEISKNQENLDRAEKSLAEKEELFAERAKAIYMNGNVSYLEVILNSRNMESLIRNTEFVTNIAQTDNDLIDDINEEVKTIEKNKEALEENKNKLSVAAAKLQSEKAQYETINLEKKSYMEKLENDLEAYEKEYTRAQESWSNLDSEIVRLQKEISDAKAKEAKLRDIRAKSSRSVSVNIGTSNRNGASLAWPLPGHYSISSPYGSRFHPILKTYRFHSGIDIPAPSGTPITCVKSGTVIMATAMSGYGNVVMVDHGDKVTVYAHCSSLNAGVGQSVSKGDVIAFVGSTGLSTGPHLHFEVRIDGKTVDPTNYV